MSRRWSDWVQQFVHSHDRLASAEERRAAARALIEHDELREIYEAGRAADRWQNNLFHDGHHGFEERDSLIHLRREIEDRIAELADLVIEEETGGGEE